MKRKSGSFEMIRCENFGELDYIELAVMRLNLLRQTVCVFAIFAQLFRTHPAGIHQIGHFVVEFENKQEKKWLSLTIACKQN